MIKRTVSVTLLSGAFALMMGCANDASLPPPPFEPREVIDLGVLVTEVLPERFWGKEVLGGYASIGVDRQNNFDVIEWDFSNSTGPLSGSNAYYELFNHGGPHVDAPSHVSAGPGLDGYPVEVFSGPLKVFDVRDHPPGPSIPLRVFEGKVEAGDVVIILTGRELPTADTPRPDRTAVTPEASEYLANLPVRAFGTDCFAVDAPAVTEAQANAEKTTRSPNHFAFLSRGIPVYEQLSHLESLIGRPESDRLYFVGVPLNIKDGDGMLVRPVVFVY